MMTADKRVRPEKALGRMRSLNSLFSQMKIISFILKDSKLRTNMYLWIHYFGLKFKSLLRVNGYALTHFSIK